VKSLFGMNVNLLESNPGWWWYLPFAFGTTTLTFAVWIIFKRSENVRISIPSPTYELLLTNLNSS
jgi:Mg2+ and Co2+ transporter CorA